MTNAEKIRRAHNAFGCPRGTMILQESAEAQANVPGSINLVPIFCHKWTCPRCGTQLRLRLAGIIRAGRPSKFITLTTRRDTYANPYEAALDLRENFARLRRRIREKFGGFEYCAVFDGHKDGWPHLHIAARSKFIPYQWLYNAWNQLTGAEHVHISAVRMNDKAERYIASYTSKCANALKFLAKGQRVFSRSENWIPKAWQEKDAKNPHNDEQSKEQLAERIGPKGVRIGMLWGQHPVAVAEQYLVGMGWELSGDDPRALIIAMSHGFDPEHWLATQDRQRERLQALRILWGLDGETEEEIERTAMRKQDDVERQRAEAKSSILNRRIAEMQYKHAQEKELALN